MYIITNTLPNAWFETLYLLLQMNEENTKFTNAHLYTISDGSYTGSKRLEFPSISLEITDPTKRPFIPDMLPGQPPVTDMDYVYSYFTEYFMNPENLEINTVYTYGSRVNKAIINDVPQLDYVIDKLAKGPYSNQLVLQISEISDITLEDPPCLRSIQFKVVDDKLDLHLYFRSNHLWNGFPVNLGAIALLLDYTCLYVPKLFPGKFYYYSPGLHIYEHDFPQAFTRLGRDIPEILKEGELYE